MVHADLQSSNPRSFTLAESRSRDFMLWKANALGVMEKQSAWQEINGAVVFFVYFHLDKVGLCRRIVPGTSITGAAALHEKTGAGCARLLRELDAFQG